MSVSEIFQGWELGEHCGKPDIHSTRESLPCQFEVTVFSADGYLEILDHHSGTKIHITSSEQILCLIAQLEDARGMV